MFRSVFCVCRNFMKDFDYFGKQKENALNTAHETMILVAEHIKEAFQPSAIISDELLSQFFTRLLKVCEHNLVAYIS